MMRADIDIEAIRLIAQQPRRNNILAFLRITFLLLWRPNDIGQRALEHTQQRTQEDWRDDIGSS